MTIRNKLPVITLFSLALVVSLNTSHCNAAPQREASTPAPFFPLGVYWPWETTALVPLAEKEKFLTERLNDLKAHNVNLVWTTNGPDSTEELGLLCRLAKARGIEIVAGSGNWLMDTGAAREEWIPDALSTLKARWKLLEGQARPLAFTISDEPQPAWMGLFGKYARQVAEAGIPATTVVQEHATEIALQTTGKQTMPFMSGDLYPFYGSTFGPRGDTSYRYYTTYMGRFARQAQSRNVAPWAMAQIYQEIWGPSREAADGQVTAMSGSVQHWLMPTPAQVRWQTWVSAALGCKGVIYFTYGLAHLKVDPTAKLTWPVPNVTDRDKALILKKDRATGGTLSLVSWPEWKPGPQYKAMSDSYLELKPLVPLLQRLKPVDDLLQLARIADSLAGDTTALLADSRSRQIYLAVVASPKRRSNYVPLIFSKKAGIVKPVLNAPPVLSVNGERAVALEPGQGALYELSLNDSTIDTLLSPQVPFAQENSESPLRLEAPPEGRDQLQLMRAPGTKDFFARIISSFDSTGKPLQLLLGTNVRKIESLHGAPSVKLGAGRDAGDRKATLSLLPGQTALYRVVLRDYLPSSSAK